MFDAGIIELGEELEWISLIVVQDKKDIGEVRICVDLRKLNDACLHDPFVTPFMNEVLESSFFVSKSIHIILTSLKVLSKKNYKAFHHLMDESSTIPTLRTHNPNISYPIPTKTQNEDTDLIPIKPIPA